jgi:hypothetical protein
VLSASDPFVNRKVTCLGPRGAVAAWAERIGVQPMRRKWGSRSSTGRLTFDRDLLRQPVAFRAKVIVHELLHLKYPRHGKTSRALVRAYLAQHGVGEWGDTER